MNGAGSTFVAPLVQSWVAPVQSELGITLNYSSVGSGAGIAAITSAHRRTSARATRRSRADQFSACKGCIQIPWALASTSVFYNLGGNSNFLHMTGPVLAKIYLGKITKWNDPAIKKLNKGKNLPNRRSPSSTAPTARARRTTSPTTSPTSVYDLEEPGRHGYRGQLAHRHRRRRTAPASRSVVKQTPGAIGYAETAYPVHNHLTYFKMQEPVRATSSCRGCKGIIAAALLDTHPAKDGSLSIVNPPKSQEVPERVSDLAPTRTSMWRSVERAACGAQEAHRLGDHEGPELRAADRSSSRFRRRS